MNTFTITWDRVRYGEFPLEDLKKYAIYAEIEKTAEVFIEKITVKFTIDDTVNPLYVAYQIGQYIANHKLIVG